jgi:hypothetical protein
MTKDERLLAALDGYCPPPNYPENFLLELVARNLAVVEIGERVGWMHCMHCGEPSVPPNADWKGHYPHECRQTAHPSSLISPNALTDNNDAETERLLSDATISDREQAIARVIES